VLRALLHRFIRSRPRDGCIGSAPWVPPTSLWDDARVDPDRAEATPDRGRPFAVIDVGSNSARMVVFRANEGEHLDVVEDVRAPLRLARDVGARGELGDEAIARTLDALHDFLAVARAAGAGRILAIATAAVRDARDGDRLVAEARTLGIDLRPIDGELEARLGFLGAVHDLPVTSGFTLDVGGGSLELTRFTERRFDRGWSLPLGSLVVSDRFLPSDPPTPEERRRLAAHATETLGACGVVELRGKESLVGIGGTVRNLARIDLRRTGYPLRLLHGYELAERRLARIVDDLAERPMARRGRVPGLNPDRADTIVGGGTVVLATMRHIGARKLVVSSRGLREGLVLDAFGGELPPASYVRQISIATLGARFRTWDRRVAERRVEVATRLHAALDPGARPALAEALEHAARILDVGRAIDHYDRFEHAAMIVTAADLAGFTHRRLGICSAILRQADDDTRLGPYARLLDDVDRPGVLRAATTLALADELHRRLPPDRPVSIACGWTANGFEVAGPLPAGWRPRAIVDRFAAVFGRPITIVPSDGAAEPAPGR
jgi:exopolyphosphatase/guanosine-5'-triphosphate,3'-diphosphate pyrophosphatase